MQKIVKKWFWAWNDDEEEKYLEEMASRGMMLESVMLGRYIFSEGEPKRIKYQLDFKGLTNIDEDEYLQMYADSGWKCASRFGSWYYFAKEFNLSDEPDITIFNDNKSQIQKYIRIVLFLVLTGFPLYFNVLFLIPSLAEERLQFPSFFFFFRIVLVILVVIHAFAMLKLIFRIAKNKKNIKE